MDKPIKKKNKKLKKFVAVKLPALPPLLLNPDLFQKAKN
jgi:hypothetical protein